MRLSIYIIAQASGEAKPDLFVNSKSLFQLLIGLSDHLAQNCLKKMLIVNVVEHAFVIRKLYENYTA